MANNFCSNCGSKLNDGVKFCGSCGTPVVAPKTQLPPEQNTTSSVVKLAVPANYKKGMLSQKGCTLVFTDSDLIVALTDKKLMNDHIATVRADTKGLGFVKRTAAIVKAGYSFSDRYYPMDFNAIISENADNFTLPYNTVQSLRYRRGTTNYGTDSTTTSTTPPSLLIKTTGGKLSFTFTTDYLSKDLIALLNAYFKGRYKGPKR